jgi:hypothetical protein
MIQYESGDSPFLNAITAYCRNIENNLSARGVECSGYCNTYGYDIKAEFERNGLQYSFRYKKHQTTQNGVVIPVNANNYAVADIRVNGLNKKPNITIGRSKLRRLFTPPAIRQQLPDPYFLSSDVPPSQLLVETFAHQINEHQVAGLKLRKGMLQLTAHQAKKDPLDYIDDIEQLVAPWK